MNNLNNELDYLPFSYYEKIATIRLLFICNGWTNNQRCQVSSNQVEPNNDTNELDD